jgi:putative DNA primase/helicase
MRLRDLARGQWKGLLPQLGVDARYLRNIHGPCPICGGEDRFRWDDQHGDGGYLCNGCGAGDGFALAMKVSNRSFQQVAVALEQLLGVRGEMDHQARDQDAEQRKAMRRVWEGATPLSGLGPVSFYLINRVGCLWPSVGLREHVSVRVDGNAFYALLAKVVTHDDKAVNLHMTLIGPDGAKAPVDMPRRVMPGKLPDGCAIRLAPAAQTMGIAEGIETAISASILHNMPVWACINANILSKWIPPEIAEDIWVFADNDANFTGQAKAYALANRLAVQYKRRVEVMVPPEVNTDWNDVHQSKMPKPTLRIVK